MDLIDVTATIRVDAETKKGSVIDVIRLIHPSYTSANASQTLTNILQGVPDIAVRCASIRINGKGRLSPVADARTLVEIILALPGTQACYFRRKSALQLCRLIGGDTALVGEIEARNQFWQETEARREVQRALLEKRTVS